MILLSPSQIKNYRECVRKWAFTKILGIRTPSTKSQELGKDIDDNQLQPYLRDARPFDFTKVTKGFESQPGISAEIATTALAWIPQPKWQGVTVQKHFVFRSPSGLDFGYQGYKDVWAPFGGVPGFDNEFPTVQDFKSTKSIRKWALGEDALRTDVQSQVYAVNAILETKSKEINLSWLYMQTEGARIATPTLVTVHTDEVAEQLVAIEKDAKEMFKLLSAAPNGDDEVKKQYALTMAPNPQACDSYGGCPFRHICNLSPEDFFASIDKPVWSKGAQSSVQEGEEMGEQVDLFSKLKKKSAAEAPVAEAPAPVAVETPKAPDPAAVEAAGITAALAAPDLVLGVNPPMPEGTPLAPPVGEAKRKPGRPKKASAAKAVDAPSTEPAAVPEPGELLVVPHADYAKMAKAFKAGIDAFFAALEEQG